jgi:predicted anti-sigma-YlaC factor YlaD
VDPRTRSFLAAVAAAAITFAAIAGTGVLLGFTTGASLRAAGVAGLVAALLLLGASRRADSFHAGQGPGAAPSSTGQGPSDD